MANINLWDVEMIPWYAFVIFWAISALRVKSTKATEPLAARAYTIVLATAAFLLLFADELKLGPLDRHFLTRSSWTVAVGIFLTYAGIALAIWARWNLGQNWSGRVSLKVDHELIRSGPYARLRHPIYSGLLLAMIGTAIVVGEWRGLLAILIVGIVHSLKAKREEALMLATFGDTYQSYRRQTGFLLPKL
jgi:protein-S-isoprenylcysteine O-methyltransferase Ste14